jgi:polyisoprenyl-phosphate glycosyltransferase
MKKISLVTPCYNEEAGIAECYETCRKIIENQLTNYAHEHIFIDNCSSDRTVEILKDIAARDRRVKIIVNARNFGAGRSPYHGLMQTTGDAVAPVLADLQTPPSLLPEMVRKWEEGYKVVVAVRRNSAEKGLLPLARRAFYSTIKRISKVEQIPNYIGFGLYDHEVIEILRSLNEPDPYIRGLIPEIGFERAVVEYDQPQRTHGLSRNSLMDLIDVALLGLTTYSKVPMRLLTIAGFTVATLSLVAGLIYLCLKLLFWSYIPFGITPILLATLFFGSVQLLALGLLGEYVALLLQYARRFPVVVEKERINFD